MFWIERDARRLSEQHRPNTQPKDGKHEIERQGCPNSIFTSFLSYRILLSLYSPPDPPLFLISFLMQLFPADLSFFRDFVGKFG